MDAEPGRSLILWTARISVILYATACLYWWSGQKISRASKLWFSSWAACLIHVLFAFHFEHRWSHTAAIRHTAEMTERVTNWYWGGGLYVNYAFLAVWGLHAFCWLRSGKVGLSTNRMMHSVAAFMMFNATVVFGPRLWAIPLVVFCFLLFRYRPLAH